jgi:anti-sigma B factor antagonist
MPTQSTTTSTPARWTVMSLTGDVDLATAPGLRQRLAEMTGPGPSFVVIDMSDLTFIDSTGLGVLVGALRRMRSHDGDLRIAAARSGIARVFGITGLDRVFELFPTVHEAVAAPMTGVLAGA